MGSEVGAREARHAEACSSQGPPSPLAEDPHAPHAGFVRGRDLDPAPALVGDGEGPSDRQPFDLDRGGAEGLDARGPRTGEERGRGVEHLAQDPVVAKPRRRMGCNVALVGLDGGGQASAEQGIPSAPARPGRPRTCSAQAHGIALALPRIGRQPHHLPRAGKSARASTRCPVRWSAPRRAAQRRGLVEVAKERGSGAHCPVLPGGGALPNGPHQRGMGPDLHERAMPGAPSVSTASRKRTGSRMLRAQ